MLCSPTGGACLRIRAGLASSNTIVAIVIELILAINASADSPIELETIIYSALEAGFPIKAFLASAYTLQALIPFEIVSVSTH